MNGDGDKSKMQQNSKLSSRFKPRRSLRHRNMKPISYAELSLNTKLRQGDTFFPKTNEQVIQPTDDQAIQPTDMNSSSPPVTLFFSM